MNTRKYQWMLYLIAATIAITIAVQVYWNYNNFQQNKLRVVNEIQLSLDNAIEEYYAGLAKTDFMTIIETNHRAHDDDRFTFGKTEIKISTNDHENDPAKVDSILVSVKNQMTQSLTLESRNQRLDSIRGFTQLTDSVHGYSVMKPNHVSKVKVLKGKKAYDSISLLNNLKPILIALDRDSLDYNKIDSLLQKQLTRKSIAISYWIDHEKGDTLFHSTKSKSQQNRILFANSKSTYLKPNEQIKLGYISPFKAALKRSSFGILLSFLLAGAIVSCLFYLLRIIKNQKQLAEVKNDLISNITHEFKTPIATIGVVLESLKNFKVLDDKQKTESYLDMSNDQLSKLNVMVEKLLETATLDSDNLELNKERVDLVSLVDTLAKKYQIQSEGKTVSFEGPEYEVLANVDIFHFENVINNLTDNALKYGGDNITVAIDSRNNVSIIKVTDTGTSLLKSNKDRIFEKFYRIPKGNTHDVKGFGIGLYYAKKIIEKHGGTISLDLNKQLTTFKISLPND